MGLPFGSMGGADWQFFVAYPTAERASADELYRQLAGGGARVFLDHLVFLPGATRRDLLHDLGADLDAGANVNLVGERRMGRTSMLNHLHGRLVGDADRIVARVNLQDDVMTEAAFYGTVLWGVGQSPQGQ